MDFQKRLQDIFERHKDEPITEIKVKAEVCLKQIIDDLSKHNWRVHKRSLPIGLDQPIMFNLSEAEANAWLKLLKPKLIVYNEETKERVVHYFDKVRNDGYLSGLLDNPNSIIKED